MADPESASPALPVGPSSREVADYLRRHPDFLIENPDLIRHLTPPETRHGDEVVDLQRYMVERLKRDNERLRNAQGDLLQISRGNLATQTRIHAALLSLLGAQTLEHAIEAVTTDFAVHLEADAVVLGFEVDHGTPRGDTQGVRLLRRGQVDTIFPASRDILLIADGPAEPAVFGAASELVRSQALLRLQIRPAGPPGLLAFGTRDPGKFHPTQGTELLSFLARVVELAIRGWLDRGA